MTNSALSNVLALGFKQIYLFGIDLGAKDPSSHHSKHSAYYRKDGEQIYQNFWKNMADYQVKGNFQDVVYTKHEFKFSAEVLAQALAEYQGSSKAYISNLVCSRYNSGEDWEKIVNSSSQKVFDNQVSRVRAKTLAGIVANPEIIDALLIYDKRVSETMAFLAKNMCADEEAQNIDFEINADGFIDFSESNPFGDPSETY